MVFLTLRLLRFSPPNDRTWKRDMFRRLSWHFYGRRRNCINLSRNPIRKELQSYTLNTTEKRIGLMETFSYRIAAGCAEHGVQFSSFMKSLNEVNITLDRKILANLAIYEPRSFQSLCEVVKQKHQEDLDSGRASPIEPLPSGIITKDMIKKVYD